MPYSDYVNGFIKSQTTISSGSEIQKTNAIGFITTVEQFTATLLLNSALVILSDPEMGTIGPITFPTKENITIALSANNYNLTNGIIIDIVLVNVTNHNITLNNIDLDDPTASLFPATLAPNQTNYYKITITIENDIRVFRIYLISNANEIIISNIITAVGIGALTNNTTGSENTALGYSALTNNTTGSVNTAVGYSALNVNTTGSFNTAVGYSALTNNKTGSENTAVGFQALSANTTGSFNTALGTQALTNTTG